MWKDTQTIKVGLISSISQIVPKKAMRDDTAALPALFAIKDVFIVFQAIPGTICPVLK